MRVDLRPHQLEVLNKIHNGCILRGGVGSGKSITILTYFFTRVMKGSLVLNGMGEVEPFQHPDINKLLIITPAKKRNDLEWERECTRFSLDKNPEVSFGGVQVIVDSWHNIMKYEDIENAFVIFDEQKLIGNGPWVKAFYKIAKRNPWVVLSATPGDTWMEFIPIFVANGYYKNRTQFIDRHVVFSSWSKFPKVERYLESSRLYHIRDKVVVDMPYERHTTRHVRFIPTDHDRDRYQMVSKQRWNVWEDEPMQNITQLIYGLRRVVNEDQTRRDELYRLLGKHPRLIIFYNFTYELDQLREFLTSKDVIFAEWNGQKHEPIPNTERWAYLVQYTAGAEAWNCTTTNAMVFYSLQYSWKVFEQCQGRIDRLDTPFTDLYYYVLRSNSVIDGSIWKALQTKGKFQEKKFAKEQGYDDEFAA